MNKFQYFFIVLYFIENIFYEKREKNRILFDMYNHRETLKKNIYIKHRNKLLPRRSTRFFFSTFENTASSFVPSWNFPSKRKL